MIIYNITIKVHTFIQTEWINWLRKEHIPDILNTGCFSNARILQLLDTDDSEGPTFAIQFHAESKALYDRYISKFEGIMRQRSMEKWGGQFVAFATVLQVVN